MTAEPLIFVAIAAYRDPELALTIESCTLGADHPERLRFGICLQFDDEVDGAGADCLEPLRAKVQMRVGKMPFHRSRGGCWARWIVQGLYAGERYTLQVDSHTRLAPGWDTEMIDQVRSLPGDRVVLTGFPALYNSEGDEDVLIEPADLPVPITVAREWPPAGWIHHPTIPAPPGSDLAARPTRFLSGAFVFADGDWNVVVRQDPEHIYAGEEFALTLRSFTHGYDLWNPARRIVWHRNHAGQSLPKYIHDDSDGRLHRRYERAFARLRTLLAGDPHGALGPYGLGSVRTLEDYRRFSGLDCATRTIHPDARLGIPPDPVTAPA